MKFIPNGPDPSLEDTRKRIQRYVDHERRHGFSKWVITDRASGAAIGDAGFFVMPDGARVELGYRLARSHWGSGLAMEVAAKWLEVASAWYGLQRIFAYCHPDHAASRRVLEKLRFQFLGHEPIHGWTAPVYVFEVQSGSE